MRLAVFTAKYPARVATFFERDMRALIEAGIEVDVFSIYPLDAGQWRFALDILGENVLPRDRVHHSTIGGSLAGARRLPPNRLATLAADSAQILAAAARYGATPLAKTAYVLPKAWDWAGRFADRYDHVLAYWGNYAGTCAYAFHRLIDRPIPFSIWLHAGTDLYTTPVFLREKMLYADSIITCCEFNRRFMEEKYPEMADEIAARIHVCYHGLNLADFAFKPGDRPARRVLAVGRLARHKGYDYLLRAAHLLGEQGFDIEVDLVGDGPERRALAQLADQLGIGGSVHFRGWLPFDGVRKAMGEATILVHPSDGLGDGLPNVLREAMALGTPVIASDVAGIPEALDEGRCGTLVPPRDVNSLATAIRTLLTDSAMRTRFARLGRKRTEERFDLWQNGSRLASHLRSLTRAAPAVVRAPLRLLPGAPSVAMHVAERDAVGARER